MARGRRPLIRHRRDSSLTARFPRSVTAVRADKEVIDFLTNCGNKNLQYLLVPSRLEAALAQLDSDRDGEIDCNEWEDAIETALRELVPQRRLDRVFPLVAIHLAVAKEIAQFTSEFLNAARQCFIMSARGVRHSTSNLRASRRRRGSYAVDASRRPPPAPAQDRQGQLRDARKAGDRPSREGGQKSHRLPQKLRRRELAIPAAPAAPRQSSRCPGYRQVRGARHRRVYCPVSFCVSEIRSFDRLSATQGKPPSTAASRSAWSSWPTSASAASAPRRGPTPNSPSNF